MRLTALLVFFLSATGLFAGSRKVHIYVTNSDDDKITIIDPETNSVSGEFKVSANPHGIVPSPDGKRFYISSESKDVLDVVDRKTNTVTNHVPLGRRPNNVAITADGRRVYVCIRAESRVDVVDTASLEKVKSIPVAKGPHNIYRTPDGTEMLASSMEGQKLTVINIKTEEPEFQIDPGGVPRPVIFDARPDGSINRLFVQLSKLHGVEMIDWKTRQITGKLMLAPAPPDARPLIPDTFSHGMAISPDHKTFWVDSLLNNTVTVFSMPDLKMITTIPVGRGPDWMVFTPDGKECFISNAGANSVSAIDTASYKELARIPVGKVPKRIIAAADDVLQFNGSRIYDPATEPPRSHWGVERFHCSIQTRRTSAGFRPTERSLTETKRMMFSGSTTNVARWATPSFGSRMPSDSQSFRFTSAPVRRRKPQPRVNDPGNADSGYNSVAVSSKSGNFCPTPSIKSGFS